MAFNIAAQSASGGVGKTKQRLVLIGFVLAAVFVVIFILQGADKKKPKAETGLTSSVTPSSQSAGLASTTSVSQYQQNLTQSANNYQRAAANGTLQTTGQPLKPAPYPQQAGAPYASYAQQQPNAYPPLSQQQTIPTTAYSQPGYAPPANIPIAAQASQRGNYPASQERDELSRERDKRAFEARYGSSVAKSIRTATQVPVPGNSALQVPASAAVNTADRIPVGLGAQLAEMVGNKLAALNGGAGGAGAAGTAAKTANQDTTTKTAEKPKHPTREEGTYMVPEGTTIDTVLQTRLNGSFAGPAKVMVTEPIYDRARQIILIPAGSILLGDVRQVQKIGEERLAVTFHRLLRPDGYTKDLDNFTGLDQIGETALKDKVNHHYMEVFGVSIALGAVSGLSMMNTNYGVNESGTDLYREGFSQSLDQSAQRILDRYTNILPTITIREGTRVKVYLTNDLYLPPAMAKPILD